MIEFTPYPKTARLFKDGLGMVVTEKIDGTNAAVGIVEGWAHDNHGRQVEMNDAVNGSHHYTIYAQSRNRLIEPESVGGKGSDNYGFAAWVSANAHALVRVLGPGLHFGEWWGLGIARNYGLTEKRFSLFNTSRWQHLNESEARLSLGVPGQLGVVPVLCVGRLDTDAVLESMRHLEAHGSYASPAFMNPEGVVVYLPTVDKCYKVTFDGDKPKRQAEAAA